VLLNVEEGCLQIRVIELIGNTEAKRTELTALLNNGVHEAKIEDHCSPLFVRLDLLEEVLIDNS